MCLLTSSIYIQLRTRELTPGAKKIIIKLEKYSLPATPAQLLAICAIYLFTEQKLPSHGVHVTTVQLVVGLFSSLYTHGFISSLITFYSWQTLPTLGGSVLREDGCLVWDNSTAPVRSSEILKPVSPAYCWLLFCLGFCGEETALKLLRGCREEILRHMGTCLQSLWQYTTGRPQGLLPAMGAGHDALPGAFVVCLN